MCSLSVANDVGLLLSSSWELSHNILDRLCYRDLLNAIKVCKLWGDVGGKIVNKRKIHYMVHHPRVAPMTDQVFLSNMNTTLSEDVDNFFDKLNGSYKVCLCFATDYLLHKNRLTDSQGQSVTLTDRLKSSLSKNCSTSLVTGRGIIGTSEPVPSHNDRQILSDSDLDSLFDQEENNDSACCVDSDSKYSDNMCSNSDNCAQRTFQSQAQGSQEERIPSVGYSVEVETDIEATYYPLSSQVKAGALVALPHYPGVKINMFYFDEDQYLKERSGEKQKKTITPEEFNTILGLEAHEQLKAFISMDTSPRPRSPSAVVDAAYLREGGKLALGGGIITNIELPDTGLATGAILIAISGPNVQTASVVITQKVKHVNAVATYISKLKKCGLPEEQSIAFMFACCGRGYTWYSHYDRTGQDKKNYFNVESSEFRKQFPNTPIFGFFGDGEIGINYLPTYSCLNIDEDDDTDDAIAQIKKKRRENIYHTFSTIIVLVSFL